jgi:hypothetical protein
MGIEWMKTTDESEYSAMIGSYKAQAITSIWTIEVI